MAVKSFDLKITGWVSLKKVAIAMCLLSSSLPTDEQIKSYKQSLLDKKIEEHGDKAFVGKHTFIKIPAWFDENEKSKDRPQSHPYPRVKNLKSIIFDIMRNDDYLVEVNEYISCLTVKLPGKNVKIYADILK